MRLCFGVTILALCAHASEYNVYIGDAFDYRVARIAADAAGNTYIAGSRTFDSNSPTQLFVMKLDPAGNTVFFVTPGGKGSDSANDIALDAAGNIYIAGSTSSRSFPVHNAYQSAFGPGFVMKLNPDATELLWSTYFPAQVSALAVDAAGNVYLTGNTTKSDFPVTAGLPAGAVSANIGGATGAFVTKLSATGDKILYSGLIAGHAKDCGSGSSCFLSIRNTSGVSVAVDPAGNGYFAGNTETSDLPTTSGALATKGVGAFVAKVNAAGTGLIYLTYIGPGYAAITPITYPANVARAIAADSAGNAYLAGSSFDPQFPSTAGAYQQGFSGPAPAPGTPPLAPPDAFALKINPGGTAAVWGTYLGGPAAVDTANAIALDASGNVWVTGTTASPIFPNQQGWMVGGNFVTGFNASGSALIYSALYPNDAAGQSIALDAAGLAHIAGPSGLVAAVKPGAAVAPRIFGIANAAFGGVLGRAAPREIISIYGPHIGPSTPVVAVPDSAGLLPQTLAGVQVMVGDVPAALLYVSDAQINAVVPQYPGSLGGGIVPVTVTHDGATTPAFNAAWLATDPQVFHTADGRAAAVNQDGTINSYTNPAKLGTFVSVWATGTGYSQSTDDRQIASAASNSFCCVAWYENPVETPYAGAAPGMSVGVTQLNFRVPAQIYPPFFSVSIYAGGRMSDGALVYVSQ